MLMQKDGLQIFALNMLRKIKTYYKHFDELNKKSIYIMISSLMLLNKKMSLFLI